MSSTVSKTPLLRTLAARGYAAKAKIAPPPPSPVVQTTVLPNKMVVASIETCLPISSVSMIFRAGSRNETYDTLGATHVLRSAAGFSNQHTTAFGVTRNIQQTGGSLSCATDRELVIYNVEQTRNHLETGLKYLDHVTTGQLFKPWELADNWHRIKADKARMSDSVRAIELMHRAAYRDVLANSIYCPKFQFGKLTTETMQHYVRSNFLTNRSAIVGTGVDHQALVGYAKNLIIDSGTGNDAKPTYYGGELRKALAGQISTVAIAAPGGSVTNTKESLAFTVLQYALGVGSSAKRGGLNGAMGKQLQTAMGGKWFSVATLNAQYSDHGLFGGIITACSDDIGKAVEALVTSLRSGALSAEDISRGRNALKLRVATDLESNNGLLESITTQAVFLGAVQNPCDTYAAIDAVTDADVLAAAKKVASGKFSLGAVGNLKHVPYLSQLK